MDVARKVAKPKSVRSKTVRPKPVKPAGPPPTLDAVLKRVQSWIMHETARPGGKRDLAIRTGLADNTLGRVESPIWRPSTLTLLAFEKLVPANWRTPKGFGQHPDKDTSNGR